MYVKAICRTMLDGYDCKSVTKFVVPPRIGERVNVRKNGKATSLKIVEIIHDEIGGEPFIIVELNQ